MNTKTKSAAVAASGIIALTLLSAFSHADSARYSDTQALNTTFEKAAEVALDSVAGTLIEAELELDDGQAIWEIDIVNDANQVVSVEVDANTGQILGTESSDDIAPNLGEVVSFSHAIKMVRAVENGALVEVELEDDNDLLIWEIETVDEDNEEAEFRIHGLTGEFL